MSPLVQAAFLGILQGLTEFLPVSSTAHLLIAERLIHFSDPGGLFTVMIQLGSILAVVWLYRVKIAEIVRGLFSDRDAQAFAFKIILATIPSLVAGALFASYVKSVLYATLTVVAVAFIVGGIIMLVVEQFRPPADVASVDDMPVGRAFAVGAVQALALIPGVSRSGGTIVAGMAMKVDRAAAAEFTFFLAIPTMFAAFVHDLVDLLRHGAAPSRGPEIAIGFIAAFVGALLVVKPFLNYVRRSGFAPFAWYRIVVGILILATGL